MSDSKFDPEGFLYNLEDWSDDIAILIAKKENIVLTEQHWEVIALLKSFHKTYQRSPNMRALINYLKETLSADDSLAKANSIYLLKLFPGSPAKIGSKIAGLPKPENCL